MPGYWSEWRKHDGTGVPVPVGTLVHVKVNDDMLFVAAGRKLSKVGVVGRDFWESWHWASEGRWETVALPIDWYRVWISRGLRQNQKATKKLVISTPRSLSETVG